MAIDRRTARPNPTFGPNAKLAPDAWRISCNRPPCADLAPWVARVYATQVVAPGDHVLTCGLFHDCAALRVQLSGRWRADTVRGPRLHDRKALFCGPHSRRMPVTVTGAFISVGVLLRPGACHALNGPSAADHLDCVTPYDDVGGSETRLLAQLDPDATAEDWIAVLENEIRALVDARGAREPDPLSAAFEALAFSTPGIPVAKIAKDFAVEQRRLQRIVRRDFGLAPKQVLCRARALDIASHLCGVADKDEAEDLALRYYDQSHLIREFTGMFGMSPSQFIATPQPLLTAALEARQIRRLETLERIAPGGIRPWE